MKKNPTTQFIKHLPIAKRILLLILIVSILPILAIGVYSYTKTKMCISDLSYTYNQKLVRTLQSNIQVNFQNYIQISDELMLNSSVRNALYTYDTLSPNEKYNIIMDIFKEIRSKFTRIAEIYNIQIVTKENIPIYNTGFLFLDDVSRAAQFQRIKDAHEDTLWYIFHHNKDTFFVLSRKIKDLHGNIIGYITMHIRPNTLTETFADFSFEDIASVTLADGYGESYFASSHDEKSPLSQDTIAQICSQPKDTRFFSYTGDKDYYISYTYFPYTGWRLITTTPYSFLNKPIRSIQFSILFITILCIIICILISRYIGGSITQQVKEEQNQKRIAEMKMLQAQINPHFLFNTLDSLKFAALMSNAPSVSNGLASLSHILRNSIVDGKSKIPISDEVKNIEDYLTIQKIRYGECIHFDAVLEEGTQKCYIMKFLLQPLVENSVIHGIQDDKDLLISLHIKLANRRIYITLKDSGKGFDVNAQYDKETNRFKSSKMSGIGLENVRQRLMLEYGTQQTFSIQSVKDEGTTILISFPAS